MTGPTSNAVAGGASAFFITSVIEALGPHALPAILFGALGGLTRWLAARYIGHNARWQKDLLAVPLGAAFALGMVTIAGPFIAQWATSATPDEWMKETLSTPEARRGISYLLGLFASEILERFMGNFKGKNDA